jgi:hypothetical protein
MRRWWRGNLCWETEGKNDEAPIPVVARISYRDGESGFRSADEYAVGHRRGKSVKNTK